LQSFTLATGFGDEVNEFTYLRTVLITTASTDQDVEARLDKGYLDKLYKSKLVGRATKDIQL